MVATRASKANNRMRSIATQRATPKARELQRSADELSKYQLRSRTVTLSKIHQPRSKKSAPGCDTRRVLTRHAVTQQGNMTPKNFPGHIAEAINPLTVIETVHLGSDAMLDSTLPHTSTQSPLTGQQGIPDISGPLVCTHSSIQDENATASRTSIEAEDPNRNPEMAIVTNPATESDYSVEYCDIGEPADKEWDLVAAFEKFCCHQHGVEVLLQAKNRWMYCNDFNIANAEARLSDKLDRYWKTTSKEKGRKEAACDSTLWEQIDQVIDSKSYQGQRIYLIEWKPVWTPSDLISVDDAWLTDSIADNTIMHHGVSRRSERIQRGEQALLKKKADTVYMLSLF